MKYTGDMHDESPIPDQGAGEPRGVSWGLERRLQFIDFRLRWEGRLNRTDLTEHFGLPTPQASLDIAHVVFGRAVFFVLAIGIYWFAITRPKSGCVPSVSRDAHPSPMPPRAPPDRSS